MNSHLDSRKNREKAFQEISTLFDNCCANVIFYSEKSSPNELTHLMYSCLSVMNAEILTIDDDEFFLRYNIFIN